MALSGPCRFQNWPKGGQIQKGRDLAYAIELGAHIDDIVYLYYVLYMHYMGSNTFVYTYVQKWSKMGVLGSIWPISRL